MFKSTILFIILTSQSFFSFGMHSDSVTQHIMQNNYVLPKLAGLFLIGADSCVLYKKIGHPDIVANVSIQLSDGSKIEKDAFNNVTLPEIQNTHTFTTFDRIIDRGAALVLCLLGVKCLEFAYRQ